MKVMVRRHVDLRTGRVYRTGPRIARTVNLRTGRPHGLKRTGAIASHAALARSDRALADRMRRR